MRLWAGGPEPIAMRASARISANNSARHNGIRKNLARVGCVRPDGRICGARLPDGLQCKHEVVLLAGSDWEIIQLPARVSGPAYRLGGLQGRDRALLDVAIASVANKLRPPTRTRLIKLFLGTG